MRNLLKRRLLWGPVLLAAVVGAGYLLVPVPDRGNRMDEFEKVQPGWTVAQVEGLLGNRGLPTEGNFSARWDDEEDNFLELKFQDAKVYIKGLGRPLRPLSSWELLKRRVTKRLRALWP